MLTDIFAHRYKETTICEMWSEDHSKLLVQSFQLLNDVCPYYVNGHEHERGKHFWSRIHDLLARELGLTELSPAYVGYYDQQKNWQGFHATPMYRCEKWMLAAFDGTMLPDRFFKERLSLVEIGFREQENHLRALNANLPAAIELAKKFDLRPLRAAGIRAPGTSADAMLASNANANDKFLAEVTELNARFRQGDCQLHYHNGFIQISKDQTIVQEIETPFWKLVAEPKWLNVDHDMKEAVDLRDTGGRDPALYAAKSLESTIKIISDEKNLTRGNEKGAAQYIDNLRGAKLIEVWETEALKHFFAKVRNPIGHGPGAAPMPILTECQTNWAIENSMIWIKSLIRRT